MLWEDVAGSRGHVLIGCHFFPHIRAHGGEREKGIPKLPQGYTGLL